MVPARTAAVAIGARARLTRLAPSALHWLVGHPQVADAYCNGARSTTTEFLARARPLIKAADTSLGNLLDKATQTSGPSRTRTLHTGTVHAGAPASDDRIRE